MDIEYPEFEVVETEGGVAVISPRGDMLAAFEGSYDMNPAFLAFLEGVRKIPGASVWHGAEAKYLLQQGEIDESLRDDIAELLTPASELKKRRI